MHVLMSVVLMHYKSQYIFYKAAHDILISSKILKTGDKGPQRSTVTPV